MKNGNIPLTIVNILICLTINFSDFILIII